MILRSHREWLAVVADLPEDKLPCNVSTVAYAIEVARAAVEAHDALLATLDAVAGNEEAPPFSLERHAADMAEHEVFR